MVTFSSKNQVNSEFGYEKLKVGIPETILIFWTKNGPNANSDLSNLDRWNFEIDFKIILCLL